VTAEGIAPKRVGSVYPAARILLAAGRSNFLNLSGRVITASLTPFAALMSVAGEDPMSRTVSIVLSTLVCAFLAYLLASVVPVVDTIVFLGGVFGFWLAYTGRLARLFRKVD